MGLSVVFHTPDPDGPGPWWRKENSVGETSGMCPIEYKRVESCTLVTKRVGRRGEVPTGKDCRGNYNKTRYTLRLGKWRRYLSCGKECRKQDS